MSANMDTADVLNAAADYIQQHGHWKGDFQAPYHAHSRGACCVLGAIAMVKHDNTYASVGLSKESNAVRAFLGLPPDERLALAAWNDKPTRRKAEVCDALREAAARLRSRP